MKDIVYPNLWTSALIFMFTVFTMMISQNTLKTGGFFAIDESRKEALKFHIFNEGALFSEAYIEIDQNWNTTIYYGPGYQLKFELPDDDLATFYFQ